MREAGLQGSTALQHEQLLFIQLMIPRRRVFLEWPLLHSSQQAPGCRLAVPPHLRVDERRVHAHARRLQPGATNSDVGLQGRSLIAQALQLRLQRGEVAHLGASVFDY